MLSLYPPETFDANERPMAGTPLNPYWEAEYQPSLLLPCWEGAGGALEDASGNGVAAKINGGVTWKPSEKGIVPQSDGLSGSGVTTLATVSGACAVACWVKIIGTGSFSYVAGTSNNFAGLRITSGTTISLCDGSIDITGGSLGNIWRFLVAFFDGITGWIYVDGQLAGSHATTFTGWNNLTLFARGANANGQACQIGAALLLPRIPTAQQIADLYANPWASFAPAEPKAWCFGATAPLSVVVPAINVAVSVVAPAVALGAVSQPAGIAPVAVSDLAPNITLGGVAPAAGVANIALQLSAPSSGDPQSVAAGVVGVGSVAAAPAAGYAPPHPTIDVWELEARPALWILEP